MGQILDKLYRAAAVVSAVLIALICVLISTQILLNGLGRVMPGILPSTIPSYADFSGFMLAASTFLALAYTLRSGGHIRVNLFVERLPKTAASWLEGFVLLAALGFVGVGLWSAGALVGESWHYGDVSSGIIPIPLWIPQTTMCFGLGLLFTALVHTLVDLLVSRHPILCSAEPE